MKRIVVFCVLTFALTWGLIFGYMALGDTQDQIQMTFVFAACMLIPAICTLITRVVTREGFRDMKLGLNIKHRPMIYVGAWFLPCVLISFGAVTYFLIFPGNFDPNLSMLRETAGDGAVAMLLLSLGTAVFLSPILNAITCLGEELGWRGYLQPHLIKKMKPIPAALITSVIWGLWHAPMIALGHNYGVGYPGFPWVGIGAMVVFCVVLGLFLGYMSYAVGNVWPAVIGHGAINAFAGISIFFSKNDPSPFIGPLPVGIIGGVGLIAAGLVSYFLLKKEPAPEWEPEAEAEA